MPFLRMRQDRQYVSIPAIDLSGTKAVTVALWANRTYSTGGGHTCLRTLRITTIPLPGSASFLTMPPVTASGPPCMATSDTWRTATANPLPEYGTTLRLFLTRARQAETK